jgi:hypothetical protein
VSIAGTWAWITHNSMLFAILGAVGVVSLIATVLLLPYFVVRIPPDYFRREHREHDYAHDRHPVVHHTLVILKNLLGVALILAGVAMIFLPGQGLLTLLIGLMLTDFPGKYRLEKRLVGRPGVLKAVNWLRARAKHPPILPPLDETTSTRP